MTDQALDAVESDPLERMMGILDAEDDAPAAEAETEAPEDDEQAEGTEQETEEAAPEPEEWEEITHNGEIKKLSKTELKELAQQGFDYTHKTQALAETRRQLEAQAQHIQQQAQFQAQFTDQIAQAKALESQLEQWKQVNWQELATQDPMQYLSLHHQYTEAKDAYNNQIRTLDHLQQQATQAAQQAQAQRLAQEAQAMKQAIPEWKDPSRADAEMTEVKTWLSRNGFNESEIGTIADHRHVVVARKAMLYDKMVAQGKQKVQNAPAPVAKPGSAAKPQTADVNKHREALKRKGKGEHAAKLIERML